MTAQSNWLYELSLIDTVDLLSIKGSQINAIAEAMDFEAAGFESDGPSVKNIAQIITLGNEITQLNAILKRHFEAMEVPIIKPGAALADAE